MTTPEEPDGVRAPRAAPWAYAWWALVGAVFGIGVIGILTIGLAFIALACLLLFIGTRASALRNDSVRGTTLGVAVPLFYLAWLNRDGPGRVCETVNGGPSCVEEYSPWPFLAIAMALVVGFVVMVRRG